MKRLEHLVERGKSDFKPGHGLGFRFMNDFKVRLSDRIKLFECQATLYESGWFDSSDSGPIGRDGKDWNKLAGVSFMTLNPKTWPKNRNSVLIGFRPGGTVENKTWEVALYVNDKVGGFKFSDPIKLPIEAPGVSMELVEFLGAGGDNVSPCVSRLLGVYGAYVQDEYHFYLTDGEHEVSVFTDDVLTEACMRVKVGPWFGGNRKAPKNIAICAKLDVFI